MKSAIAALLLISGGAGALMIHAADAKKVAKPSERALNFPADLCKVTDGDTIRCGKTRVRMIEIDAPEMPGHCRKGRVCAVGDPFAAKANLVALLAGKPVKIVRYGEDAYRRTLGDVRVNGKSMSCAQIIGHFADRQLKWKDYGVTTHECP